MRIDEHVAPLLQKELGEQGIHAELRQDGDKLYLHYAPLKAGTGYVQPAVLLEFGARSTGEPNQAMPVHCDIADAVETVDFPTATPVVMKIERTFWEKATAAHVFCLQDQVRGAR
ncbi:nucleotidyl transferase AbiEii/AbiGii toxin family protein [Noviherbaspirillum denitrificans]|uniref:nucleotidyl transferase AbiEii/AbiGii toxin family protein n=1 Tax=Noviherbaspirillum denitrificans TaxID=1968433 RepID=UPI001F4793F2|nr:nucleotidyl transferase AbiEii/AbiGii toxin family protein [Noviherbaspirillum denitrificans]